MMESPYNTPEIKALYQDYHKRNGKSLAHPKKGNKKKKNCSRCTEGGRRSGRCNARARAQHHFKLAAERSASVIENSTGRVRTSRLAHIYIYI